MPSEHQANCKLTKLFSCQAIVDIVMQHNMVEAMCSSATMSHGQRFGFELTHKTVSEAVVLITHTVYI